MPSAHPWVYWALALALAWLGLRWFERVQLYAPSRQLAVHPGTYGMPYETARPVAADGVRLHGWFIPGRPGERAVLLLHGNAGNIGDRVHKARLLHGLGVSVFLLDYRGYGESQGRPDERGTYLDAEAAYRWLAGRGFPAGAQVFYGESLGCGVAVELARRHPPAALVLESPFTSVVDMGRLVFPLLPVERMVRFRYDNLAKIGGIRAPLLILHSPADEIVPYAMGRRLYEAAPGPKRFADLSGGHNDGYEAAGGRYLEALAAALGDGVRS